MNASFFDASPDLPTATSDSDTIAIVIDADDAVCVGGTDAEEDVWETLTTDSESDHGLPTTHPGPGHPPHGPIGGTRSDTRIRTVTSYGAMVQRQGSAEL